MCLDLRLANNRLQGTIPSELGLVAELDELHLQGNSVSGPVPVAVCNLVNATFARFYANCDALQSCPCCTHCCSGATCQCQNHC